MKILVVDDHALVREGLRQVLKGLDEDVEVLDAPHCARAFELTAQHPDLDLVLLDYHLPDMTGLEALGVLAQDHPELPVIMLSGSAHPQIIGQVLAGGAAGFLSKAAMSDDLLAAVQMVLAGEVFIPPEYAAASAQAETPDADLKPPALTRRQEEVLQLLLAGRSNKDISQLLDLSEETTKNHVSNILRCFGVQSRVQAVLEATRRGYTRVDAAA